MELRNLLEIQDIDQKTVLVLRHRPKEPELRRVLPWLAAEQPKVFNAYQQTQTPKVEKQMLKASHIASFIGDKPGHAVFVGLYENRGHRKTDRRARDAIRPHRELAKYGHIDDRKKRLWFNLSLTDQFLEWSGKLIVRWPAPEIAWSRWADKNVFEILAILEDSLLSPEMPHWRELILRWDELQIIPKSWRAALSQWRGIYFILDQSDGKGYVGSAYGADNLLGRWLGYSKSGDGGNKRLKKRKPTNLRFSILERASPDMEPADVVQLESTWKDRLHTREFGLNAN